MNEIKAKLKTSNQSKNTKNNVTLNKNKSSSDSQLIDLNVGDLVVKIKKLDKKSNFDLNVRVGTAGIRG